MEENVTPISEAVPQGPTQDELTAAISADEEEFKGLTPEEAAVAAKILPAIANKANARAEANKAVELQKIIEQLTASNKKLMETKIEEYRKILTPPTPEELGMLLNQEYVEFPVKLRSKGGTREFVIRELPLEAEMRLTKMLQKNVGPRIQELSRMKWTDGHNMIQKIEEVIAVVPGMLETVSECVAICLDPFGEDEEISGTWVRRNIGSTKLVEIVHAQLQASRYRDFLSLAGRLFPSPLAA